MLIIKGIYLLAAIAYGVCQMPTDAETKTSNILTFTELRQVMREGDPTGKNHSIKVSLLPYQPLPHLVEWDLLLVKNNEPTAYALKGDGQDPTMQTELVFKGNLVESDIVTLLAKNRTNAIGVAVMTVPIKDLKSDVAWVGDYQSGKSASLRVTVGELVNEVMVGRHSCKYTESPCYYITPNPHPTNIERCHSPFDDFKLCDDRVISFKEPSSLPAIFHEDDKFLEVEVPVTQPLPVIEVVAYDPLDHKRIFTDFPYQCLFPMGSEWNKGENIRCRVSLTLPTNTTYMMVMVVKLDAEGDVIESSLQAYGDPPLPPSNNTGLIVGAVFGTMIGLAVIVLGIICCLKKTDEKKAKTERGGSAVYKTTTTTDPAEKLDDFQKTCFCNKSKNDAGIARHIISKNLGKDEPTILTPSLKQISISFCAIRRIATMFRLTCFLATTVVVVSSELLLQAETKLSSNSLNIEKITQIMNDNDPTGKNHSIHITISEHEPLDNVVEWKFFQHTNEGGSIQYKIPGDGQNPTHQTELIFNGNLIESDSYLLQAKDSSEDIAMDYKVVDITDLETNVAWVGEKKYLSQSSLRVMTSERVGNITVSGNVCIAGRNPCYIIAPDAKPSSIERCATVSLGPESSFQQCDERVMMFVGIDKPLPVELQEDGSLTVEFTYAGEQLSVEVVTYDTQDKTNVFSSYPYKCRFPLGKFWEDGDQMKCRHDLTLPEDQTEMMVLIVVTDKDNNVVKSTLQYFDKNAHNKLSIEEVSRIMRDDDATGEKHDIRVQFSHQSLQDVHQWKLTLQENAGDITTYTNNADGSNPSTQTEVIFNGRLVKSDSMAFQAMDSENKLIAIDVIPMAVSEIKSQVTWVGGDKETSLRVTTNKDFPEIAMGDEVCTEKESPCYYITPSTKPASAKRCIENVLASDRVVKLCDERITEIPEINPEPTVTLTEDGKIVVQFQLTDKENFPVEVLTYTSKDHGKVFSQHDYSCLVATGVEQREPDTVTCLHKPSLPEGEEDFNVLIVKTDMDGNAIASSLVVHGGKPDVDENVGVIIGAVVGGIIGVALVAFLVIYCMKKKQPESGSQATSYKYSAADQVDKGEGTATEGP
ncbi:uncharacterized protein [Palaemon carinicauda]|uniref:uncharacterized protein n=1 Tax=Palaemon carinicauda TaxID=392227 RepID=UPI0035B57084